MAIEYDLRTYLLADATVSGLVVARVYPVIVPENAQYPCVTYQMVSRVRLSRPSSGPPSLVVSRIQFDAWSAHAEGSDGYASGKALADAVRRRLDGTTGSLGSGLASVQDVRLDSERDMGLDDAALVWRVSMDFAVTHTEDNP